MFLVIEGIDGSGKSTQVALLQEYFLSKGKKVTVFDFPRYNEPSSFFVSKFLNGGYGENLSPEVVSLFFALDRFDASKSIFQAIQESDIVLSNRYVSSNMIHQSGKILERGGNFDEIDIFLNWLENIEFQICGIPRPDKVFFLDVPPKISLSLLEKKEQRAYIKEGNKDINEQNVFHQEKAYESALYIAKKYDWVQIPCFEGEKIFSSGEISKKILEKFS